MTRDERLVIVFDGRAWHIRRLRLIEHALDVDEKIYRCDQPIANDLPTLAAAVNILDLRLGRRR